MRKAFPSGPQHPPQQKCSCAASMWTDKGKPRTLPPYRSFEWEPLLPPVWLAQERNEGGFPWKLCLLPATNMLTHSVLGAEKNYPSINFSICVASCLASTPPNTLSTPLCTSWSFWISSSQQLSLVERVWATMRLACHFHQLQGCLNANARSEQAKTKGLKSEISLPRWGTGVVTPMLRPLSPVGFSGKNTQREGKITIWPAFPVTGVVANRAEYRLGTTLLPSS